MRSWPIFHQQFPCAMFSKRCLNSIDQTIFFCNVVQECPIQFLQVIFFTYFLHKHCLSAMSQHCTGNFLVQCWSREMQTKLQIIFLWQVVCGLWVNIAQVISYAMLVQADQDNILQVTSCDGYELWANIVKVIYSVQRCLRHIQSKLTRLGTVGQHCTDNCLVQCRSRQI